MIQDIFKTSIYKTQLKNPKYIKYFKDALAYEKKKNKEGSQITNVGGYQSTTYTGLKNKKINQEVFLKPAYDFCNLLHPKNLFRICLQSWWMNENSYGDYNSFHRHTTPTNRVILSGIYYIEAPKDCGRLVFQNFDGGKFNDPNLKYFNDPNFWSVYYEEPQQYDLIIFPPAVMHMVEPNRSKKKRISVAFNIATLE